MLLNLLVEEIFNCCLRGGGESFYLSPRCWRISQTVFCKRSLNTLVRRNNVIEQFHDRAPRLMSVHRSEHERERERE